MNLPPVHSLLIAEPSETALRIMRAGSKIRMVAICPQQDQYASQRFRAGVCCLRRMRWFVGV
jgi:pyruvate carboxylase